MEIKRTETFNLAYRFATETKQNIFLTGKAGTGKTTFLKYLRENSIKNIIVCAPTGVAAINARGVTLHSFFQLPLGIIPPNQFFEDRNETSLKYHPMLSKIHYYKDKLNLLRSMELLVIDEASMMSCYIVDAIDAILRNVRNNPDQIFGGVQVLFIGDLYQLPPVVKKEDVEILRDYYSSPFFFDSIALQDNPPIIIELEEIFRQKDDNFIEILNGVRNNNITEENFRLLNSRLNRNFLLHDNEGYIILTTHNYQSDEINKNKIQNLSSPACVFHAEVNGEFPEHTFPAESELILKTGAQVMFLKNDTEGKQYFNGKIGVITYLDKENIKVKCKDDLYEVEVKKCEWQNIRYKMDTETGLINEEVLGTFIQYPLRLAWAITIHKSQGLTFDKIIIDAEKAFAMGQVYVALSRCTSLEGLILKSPINNNFLGAHDHLIEWENKNKSNDPLPLFALAREDFILQELQNIFTWKNWYYELKALNDFLLINRMKIPSDIFSWIDVLIQKEYKLFEISEKFKQTILRLNTNNSCVEKNEILQQKIKNAAEYFYNEINNWKRQFLDKQTKVGTKKLARKIDDFILEINKILIEILQNIKSCRAGFNLDVYLKNRHTSYKEIKNNEEYIPKSKILKTDTVEETIKYLREGKNINQIAIERNLVVGTIEGHLAKAIRQRLINIEEVMSIQEVKSIAEYFHEDVSNVSLAKIKEKLPKNISYGKLKMILAWISVKQTK